jgi:hypothetical protein
MAKRLKDDLEELRAMRQRSMERQGRDPIKEAGKESGPKAMGMPNSTKNFDGIEKGQGYTARTKLDASQYQNATPKTDVQGYKEAQQSQRQEQVKPKAPAPRSKPGPGREGMMAKMEEERKRRMRGQSAVIGS